MTKLFLEHYGYCPSIFVKECSNVDIPLADGDVIEIALDNSSIQGAFIEVDYVAQDEDRVLVGLPVSHGELSVWVHRSSVKARE